MIREIHFAACPFVKERLSALQWELNPRVKTINLESLRQELLTIATSNGKSALMSTTSGSRAIGDFIIFAASAAKAASQSKSRRVKRRRMGEISSRFVIVWPVEKMFRLDCERLGQREPLTDKHFRKYIFSGAANDCSATAFKMAADRRNGVTWFEVFSAHCFCSPRGGQG